ncbi:MAG: precorrin-6y C5,15-methyltransferase (decarboxylating) subunit CbiE [Pirellulales bacterium]|nr:precorrin-6y C5,15-methyltransferase (decarboxylating) subunit CbiE [Pirellulales bacterium]
MAAAKKIHVIGIGEDGLGGLTETARRLIEEADLILGENHCLALVPESRAERFVVGTNFEEGLRRLEDASTRNAVVLASGDPLFYGVARFLCDRLGKDRFEVIPHVSSMQLAFARVKESWEEAFLTNLASHGVESVLEPIRTAEKVGLFTSDSYPPSAVARILLEHGLDYFTAYVCENLGSPDERVTRGELSEIAEQEFSPLNVMILVRKPHRPDRPSEAVGRRLFGNPDEVFLQSKPKRGLLTPAEIRSMALAEMDLGPTSVVWDIGAGSGSVAIEAAQISTGGTIYAIEMDPEDHQLIVENARRFKVINLVPILGRAPEAWRDLPDPDAVFVGGSGRGIWRLVDGAFGRLRPGGRLVATMGSVDNLAEVHHVLRGHGPDVKVWMINVARGNYQLERVRFESLNPIFLVSVAKPS